MLLQAGLGCGCQFAPTHAGDGPALETDYDPYGARHFLRKLDAEGASELRVKESDRISVVISNLRAIGADAEEKRDGFRIAGGTRRTFRGKVVTHSDHRIAMAFGVLGYLDGNDIEIDDRDCVGISYPDFWTDLDALVT